jgi:hypothetical protein
MSKFGIDFIGTEVVDFIDFFINARIQMCVLVDRFTHFDSHLALFIRFVYVSID